MKTRIHMLVVVALATCLAISCSRAPRLKLCNHTDSNLKISVEDWSVTIPKGITDIFTFPFETGRLIVTTESKTWEYHFPYPPREYCQPSGAAVIYAQLEPDGRLYVFLPKTKLPTGDLKAQPEGFPLEPKSETK